MIVEDSERILGRLAEDLLAIDGVRIAGTAATQQGAESLLAPGNWDLAVLDLQLAQGSGLRLLRTLRADPRTSSGTIAVFTNYAFKQYRDRCMALGADYFFDKARDFGRVTALAAQMAPARANR